MAGEIWRNLLSYGLPLMLGGLALLYWPWRRERRFSTTCHVDAPRERIWDIYHTNLDDPLSAALHRNVLSVAPDAGEPGVSEIVMDTSGGHGAHSTTVRQQTLLADRPWKSVSRVVAIDGRPFPNGPMAAETLELAESDGGTRLTLNWRGETANWGQYIGMRRHIGRYLRNLKTLAETGDATSLARRSPARWKPLALSALTLASFAFVLGWWAALGIVLVVVLHEYGHWLAMRVTGQPAPRVLLIPFLGGIAVPNHPHRTLFDDAFCALMGPALSIVPCMVFIALTATMLPATIPLLGATVPAEGAAAWKADLLVASARLTLIFGVLNALQLVPVLPLDGGQVLRAIVQSFGGRAVKWGLLALSLLGLVGLTLTGDYILAAILGLGALQAWYLDGAPRARPMRVSGMAVIGTGYMLSLVVHLGASGYGYYVLAFAREYLPA